MRIYEPKKLGESIPEGVQGVAIPLNGRLQSDLDWSDEIQAAHTYKEQGLSLFWKLDLGLFEDLCSVDNESQFLSLSLSLNHYLDAIWELFQEDTVGVSLYDGSGRDLPWDEALEEKFHTWLQGRKESKLLKQLFERDALAEYFDLLATRLPEEVPVVVFFDLFHMSDPLHKVQFLNQECFPHLQPFEKGKNVLSFIFNGVNRGELVPNLGLCLPLAERGDWECLRLPLQSLQNNETPFRLIPEANLINAWDGLDQLVVCSEAISTEGVRKCRGFAAAGGTLCIVGPFLGIPNEIPWEKI